MASRVCSGAVAVFKHAQFQSIEAFLAHPAQAGLPLHARIQRAIRQLILDGALEPGNPLPASRALAISLRVSRDTVESAYAQLHADGFIMRRIGSGSFVSAMTGFSSGRGVQRRDALPRNQPLNLSQRGAAIVRSGGVVEQLARRPFAPGIPDTRLFPLQVWERLQRQVLKDYGPGVLNYGDPQGTEPLRRVIADYLNIERGAHVSADRVVVLTSAQQALSLCATVLLDPGDGIFIEDPVYFGARRAFDAAGLACAPIRVDGQGMMVDQLVADPHHAKVVYVTPSHQYPTQATLALPRRLALIEWAARHQGWIIEDDYDGDFHYAGPPTACIQGLDPHQRTIYVGTFSKSMFPGLRLGYVVLPPQLVKPFTVARTVFDQHTASIPQLTLARFIESGHFGAHMRIMKSAYAERLRALDAAVRQKLADFVEPLTPVGGLQIPCLLRGTLSEQATIEAARSVGVELMGLSGLSANRDGKPGWLMGFAAYTPDEIDAAVSKLATALKSLGRS